MQKKVRAINFRNDRKKNSKKQTKRKILDTLRKIKSVYPRKLSDERWSKMFKSPSTVVNQEVKVLLRAKLKKLVSQIVLIVQEVELEKLVKKQQEDQLDLKRKNNIFTVYELVYLLNIFNILQYN